MQKAYVCKYCGKQCRNGQSLGGHMSTCKCNPKTIFYRLKQRITNTSQRYNYQIICGKCEKQFTLELTQNEYKTGKYRKHCSRSCANSRTFSDKTKKQMSQNHSGGRIRVFPTEGIIYTLTCKYCGKQFIWHKKRQDHKMRNYCSFYCSGKDSAQHINYSEIFKNAYLRGTKHITGGKCKFFEYKGVKVQGTWELKTCQILDLMVQNNKIISWERNNDRIPYMHQNDTEHVYIPDFKVFSKASWYYLEVKGRIIDIDKLKWNETRRLGYELSIWNANVINRLCNTYGLESLR